ncbi:putative lipoprotein signal peptidase [Brucella neotomae 5K33]|nr:putative lipoprotein signal peptidase [Brucella neotomae 5K33]
MKGDRMKRHAVWSSLFVVILAVLIDQGIKYLVESRMFYGQQIDLLPFLALFSHA